MAFVSTRPEAMRMRVRTAVDYITNGQAIEQ